MKANLRVITSLFVIGVLFGTLFLPTITSPSQANILQNPSTMGTAATEYWALVVGVGKYAENPEQDRPLMVVEAKDFKDLLLQTSWWSEDHIKILTAEEATRGNILEGLRWLINRASSDDVVLVYLSTHGNHLPFDILPKDEEDGEDEMLVSYWGFAYNTSFIDDDQINIMLNQLKSNQVCLIVDSCYAGGFNDHYKLLKSSPEQQRVILMGSCEDEVSYSGGFAPYLIDGFRGYADSNGDGIVTAEEAFTYAQPRSFSPQTPTIYDGYPGELPLTMNTIQKASSSSSSAQQRDRSLIPLPSSLGASAETSVLCGYITDSDSNQPVKDAVITVTSRINFEESYTNMTMTDATGFYSMHVPATRIRVSFTAQGYCDKSGYQVQVEENKTYWANLSLVLRPPETARICGYISSQVDGSPLMANVSLSWQVGAVGTYQNVTVSASNGFYQMNVAPGSVDLDFSKYGYYDDSSDDLTIIDFETLWLNVTLYPYPAETSTICGYITDSSTGLPLSDVRVQAIWVNFSISQEYERDAQTDANGFFSMPIAPGEIYFELRSWEYNYNYYDPYRHDAVTGKPLWINISLQQNSISVDIAKPLQAIYMNNQRVLPWSSTLLIGPISIEATSDEFYYGPGDRWDVQKVEFYIDDELQATITDYPYVYDWTEKTAGTHTIKVIAYGFDNQTASKEISVTKIM